MLKNSVKISKGLLSNKDALVLCDFIEKPMNLKASIQELSHCDGAISENFKKILKSGLEIATNAKQQTKGIEGTKLQKQAAAAAIVANLLENAKNDDEKLSALLAYEIVADSAKSYVLPNFNGIKLIIKKEIEVINGKDYECMVIATQYFNRTLTVELEKMIKIEKIFVFDNEGTLKDVELSDKYQVVKKSFEISPALFDIKVHGEKFTSKLSGMLIEFNKARQENRNLTSMDLNNIFNDKLVTATKKLNSSLDNLVMNLRFYNK